MSTRIYNGLRFNAVTLRTLLDLFQQMRPAVSAIQERLEKTFVANYAVSLIDDAAVKGETANQPLMAAIDKVSERQRAIKTTGQRDPAVDFDLNFTVIPYDGQIFGTYYTDCGALRDLVLDQSWIQPYGFWDNSDPDEDVSETEWERRGQVWEAILSQDHPYGRLGACGYCVDMQPRFIVAGCVDVLQYQPSHDVRLRRLVRETIATKRFMDDPDQSAMSMMRHVTNLGSWLQTEEGQAVTAAVAADLAPKLPEITNDILLRSS